jgi:hypothetical protein
MPRFPLPSAGRLLHPQTTGARRHPQPTIENPLRHLVAAFAFQPAQGANQNIQAGTVPKVTRTAIARDVGIRAHQQETAIRVANVPTNQLEEHVEAPTPPTITKLAEQGTPANDNQD